MVDREWTGLNKGSTATMPFMRCLRETDKRDVGLDGPHDDETIDCVRGVVKVCHCLLPTESIELSED